MQRVIVALFTLATAISADQCVLCEPDTFCFMDNMYNCPSHSSSVAGSDNESACVCHDGYRQSASNNQSCVLCSPDTFCASEQVGHCPALSSSGSGAVALSDCVCHSGHYGPVGGPCQPCVAGTYEMDNTCLSCPAQSSSEPQSAAGTDCQCNRGYSGPDGGICEACEPGRFKDNVGNATCTDCPANAHGPGASQALAQCWCNAGHSKSAGVCRECARGTYKTSAGLPGDLPCATCPQHSYTVGNGSTMPTQCLCDACYDYASSCEACAAGKAGPGAAATCVLCAAGSKSAAASSTCEACEEDTYQNTSGATACIPCPQYSESPSSSTSLTQCACSQGHAGVAGDCAPCMSGKHKTSVGSELCQSCDLGSTIHPANNGSHISVYTLPLCVLCATSEYGRFTTDAVAVCATCEGNTALWKPSGSTGECRCRPGFEGPDCTPCRPGRFKSIYGSGACGTCAPGSVSPEQALGCSTCPEDSFETNRTVCQACPSHASAPEGTSGQCTCDAGYPLTQLGCSACAAGTFDNAASCQPCRSDSFSEVTGGATQAVCEQCHPHMVSPEGSASSLACACVAGYTGTGPCSQCVEGSWKSSVGSTACSECPAGTHWPQAIVDRDWDRCADCPGNSTSAPRAHGINNCNCVPGFRRVQDDECQQCPPDTFCAGDTALAVSCPTSSSSLAGSASILACGCVPGFFGAAGACAVCPVNSFCMLGIAHACRAHATTKTLQGRSELTDCFCDSGYYDAEGTCALCPIDSYCYGNERLQCGPNSTSMAGAGNRSACYCDAGTELSAGECVPCALGEVCGGVVIALSLLSVQVRLSPEAGTFPSAQNDTRAALAVLAGSPLSDVRIDSAVEDPAGVFLLRFLIVAPSVPDAQSLAQSVAGALSVPAVLLSVLGAQAVITTEYAELAAWTAQFPTIQTSVTVKPRRVCAATATGQHDSCVCPGGSSCNETSATGCEAAASCVPCVAGSYCHDNLANLCPDNQTSEALSASAGACRCVAAYYRWNGQCELCPLHSYCAAELRYECAAFDPGLLTVAAGRETLADCRCRPGHFRLDRGDACRPCPLNFYCPSEFDVSACMQYGHTQLTASQLRSDCVCHGGFQWRSDGIDDSCLSCVDHRCSDGQIAEFCSAERMPNADHSQCVCRPGSSAINTMDCSPCLDGTVKPREGDESCAPCPTSTYSHNTTHCAFCPPSSNTSAPDGARCMCTVPLISLEGECVPCHVNTVFTLFRAGVTTLSGVLLLSPGSASLALFHLGFCDGCHAHASTRGVTGATAPAQCVCDAGYVRQGAGDAYACEACPVNTFESHGVCVHCGIDAVSAVASSAEAHCACPEQNCSYGILRPPKFFGRLCLLHCVAVEHECIACRPGSVKAKISGLGNEEPCVLCNHNYFQELAGQTVCDACTPSRVHFLLGSHSVHDCHCHVGFFPDPDAPGPNTPCLPCAPGHYKGQVSQSPCQRCDAGSFADTLASTACLLCSAHAPVAGANTTLYTAASDVRNCTCRSGYEQLANACLPCVHGSFKTAPGSHACTVCGSVEAPNKYGDAAVATHLAAHCSPCAPNSGQNSSAVSRQQRMLSPQDCLCFPHFEHNGSLCLPCPTLTVKPGYSQGVCAHCAAGQYVQVDSNRCFECYLATTATQLGQTQAHEGMAVNAMNASLRWGESQDDCVCHLGYQRIEDECAVCAPGHYRGARLPTVCLPCAADTYQDSAASLRCQACPGIAYTNGTGRTSLQDCQCPAGFAWNATDCVACPPGSVRNNTATHSPCDACLSGEFQDASGQRECKRCGPNEWSEAPFSALDSCRCSPGSGLRDGQCSHCVHGAYSAGGSSTAIRPECVQCPEHKNTSATARQSIDACTCAPGYGIPVNGLIDPALSCAACATGYYAGGNSNVPCTHCGFGTVTQPEAAATGFGHCQCNRRIGLTEA